jgi:hypothetical protein
MDLTAITTAIGLATTALGATEKAVLTAEAVKKLFSADKKPDNGEVQALLNTLAAQLTAANMLNVDLSEAIKTISRELKIQDDFENEKSRYELFQTGPNDIVYRVRQDHTNGQPDHFICPVCLNSDRKFSFITGEGDFKVCQKIREHVFRFKTSPPPRVRTGRSSGW